MADTITVVQMDTPSGMEEGWAQQYEIAVTPDSGRLIPELPFLHKGDGFTMWDGTEYSVERATQRSLKMEVGVLWSWIYRVTGTSDNSGERGWE